MFSKYEKTVNYTKKNHCFNLLISLPIGIYIIILYTENNYGKRDRRRMGRRYDNYDLLE